MKKGFKYSMAAVVAASSLTPVMAASAAENTNVAPGVYNTATNDSLSLPEFQNLKTSAKVQWLTNPDVYIVLNDLVYQATDLLTLSNEELAEAGVPIDEFDGELVSSLKVESVSATNKTTVKVVFNKEIDSVTADNFTIEGANVTAATLAADKKTVTLSVSGLNYETEYAVTANDILIDGTTTDFGAVKFTTPAVTDIWELQISTKDASLIADGADNTLVTFKLIDKTTGEVDKDADNVVLDLNTTYGTLAQKRVTVQDGVATVLLTSEFSNTNINTKIDAQIIEASGDYKDLINHVAGTLLVPFKTTTTENVDSITLVAAEANQADRITLFFDNEVSLKHFVATNSKGDLYYQKQVTPGNWTNDHLAKDLIEDKVDAEDIRHQLRLANSVAITQGATNFEIKGFKPVAGNEKAIEVILEKTTVLKDNANVEIEVNTVNSLNKTTKSSADFKVTDARKPEATSVKVEGLNTLKVKFSEAIADSAFQIDGQFKGVKQGTAIDPAPANAAAANKAQAFTYEFGEFNPTTLVDNRDLGTIELTAHYWEAGDNKLSGYFGAGQHTVQVSSTEDFAAATDPNNIGTTQNLAFTITADPAKPTATVTVESPEQFRVKFDKQLAIANAAAFQALFTNGDAKLQYLDTDGEYKDVATREDADGNAYARIAQDNFKFTRISASEYLIELKDDWTKIYDTDASNKNYYNDKYRILIAKNTVTNLSNGLKNDEIKIDLNYAGSPLNTPDTTSPVISTIERVSSTANFNVTMSEPVKLKDHVGGNETLAQGQGALQETTVQFIGKDKDGKTVTVNGTVNGYADTDTTAADKVLNVTWASYVDGSGNIQTNTVTPQTIVDAGGSEDWTIVIRSISDDVGNTAASATKEFKVTKSPAGNSPFFVEVYPTDSSHAAYDADKVGKHRVEGYGNGNGKDTIEITFSEGVQFSGDSDATNPAYYTLNGVTLPVGTSISVENDSTATYATDEGLEKVVITLPDGTLNIGANVSNVITINKNLVSYDGSKIEGPTEIVVNVDENAQAADLAVAQAAVNALSVSYDGTAASITLDGTSNGETVTWSSDTPAIVANDGTVTRPAYGQSDATVTLTATATVNGETATKDFTVTVNALTVSSIGLQNATSTVSAADNKDLSDIVTEIGTVTATLDDTTTVPVTITDANLAIVSGSLTDDSAPVVITVTVDGKTATHTVTVTP